MIRITLTAALFLYGAIIMLGLLMLYIVGELRARRVYRVLEKQFLWRCAYCGFLYLDIEAQVLSECPRCGSFNAVADAQDKVVGADKQRLQPTEAVEDDAIDPEAPRRNPARRKRPGQSRRGPRRRR